MKLFYQRVQHDGNENTCKLIHDGRKKSLLPMKEISPVEQLEEKLVIAKLEEPSSTRIEKQVKVIKEEIVMMNSKHKK